MRGFGEILKLNENARTLLAVKTNNRGWERGVKMGHLWIVTLFRGYEKCPKTDLKWTFEREDRGQGYSSNIWSLGNGTYKTTWHTSGQAKWDRVKMNWELLYETHFEHSGKWSFGLPEMREFIFSNGNGKVLGNPVKAVISHNQIIAIHRFKMG